MAFKEGLSPGVKRKGSGRGDGAHSEILETASLLGTPSAADSESSEQYRVHTSPTHPAAHRTKPAGKHSSRPSWLTAVCGTRLNVPLPVAIAILAPSVLLLFWTQRQFWAPTIQEGKRFPYKPSNPLREKHLSHPLLDTTYSWLPFSIPGGTFQDLLRPRKWSVVQIEWMRGRIPGALRKEMSQPKEVFRLRSTMACLALGEWVRNPTPRRLPWDTRWTSLCDQR